MEPVNLRKHKNKFKKNSRSLRYFITRTESHLPQDMEAIAAVKDGEVWKEVDCLSCANCCKSMSPTYTFADIKRIAAFLHMRPKDFKDKWLYFDKKGKDWMNKSRPCQFLDMKTHKCSVYAVRPADCAGFPHLVKKPFSDYMHVHKQNIEYCPATMLFIEKIRAAIKG